MVSFGKEPNVIVAFLVVDNGSHLSQKLRIHCSRNVAVLSVNDLCHSNRSYWIKYCFEFPAVKAIGLFGYGFLETICKDLCALA